MANGGIIGPANVPTQALASGVWSIDELFLARDAGIWPARFRYINEVLSDSPIGFWLLDETSGSTAADSAGSYPLTYINSPTLGATGPGVTQLPRAVTFNGSTQNAKGDNSATFTNSASGSWTLEAWIRWTTTTLTQTFLTVRDHTGSASSTTALLIANRVTAGDVSLSSITPSLSNVEVVGGSGLNNGNWHHIVGTAAPGGAMRLYINGSLIGSTSTARNTTSSQRSITIATNRTGLNTYSQYTNGTIAACAYYDYALNATQVAAHNSLGRT